MKEQDEETPKGAELTYIQAAVIIFGLGIILAVLIHNARI